MRRLLLLVAAVVLVDTMFYAAITPLLPSYRDDLGLSKTAAGILSGSYAAGTLLGSLPAGALVTRFGAKRILLMGLAFMSVTSVVFGFAENIVLLDTARFLQGVGGACSWGAGLAWLIGAAPADRRGELIGTAIAAAIGGVLLGPVLGGAATVLGTGPVFSLVALLGAGLAAWALSMDGPPRGERSGLRAVVRAMASRPVGAAFWLAMLPSLYSGTLVVLGPLRLDELGAEGVAIGAVFLVGAALEAIVSAVVGRVSDRRGRLVPIRAGLIAAAAFAVVLPLPGTAVLLAAAIIGAVVALAAFWAPSFAMLSDAGDEVGLDQGYAFALTNLAWAGGQVSGAAAGAWVAERAGDAVPYAGLAVLCSVTLVVLAIPRRPRARAAA